MKHPSSISKFGAYFISAAILIGSAACVSVDFKPKAPNKSKVYTFTEPSKPFDEMETEQADHAWQNQKTGNTVAVLTECSETRDPSLISIEGETISALSNPQKLKSDSLEFSGRGSLRTLVEGQVDGVSVKMDVLTFKKNSCSYTLSYIGRIKSFEKDQAAYEQFLKGFVVP